MERFQLWGFFGLIALTAAQNIAYRPDGHPSYLLLTPKVLRSGVPTSISVGILINQKVTVSARIVQGSQTLSSNSTMIERGLTKLLTLPPIYVSEFSDNRVYRLEVQGHVGNVHLFSNSTQLKLDLKGFSILIQTDKVNYLPGQVVKIRVVSINSDGRPHNNTVDLAIKNPRGYLIRQWLSSEGVFVSKEFELSDNPPLGAWVITATVQGISSKKTFHVAHYVLPKFEVMITTSDVIYRKDPVEGFVTAKYLYGKPVQGYMNITLTNHGHGLNQAYHEYREIDGTEDFAFDVSIGSLLYKGPFTRELYQPIYLEYVIIVVHVTEHLTGLTYNSSVMVSVAKSRYRLSFEEYPTVLRPNLHFNAKLKISTYNGKPLSLKDQQNTVQVSVAQHSRIPPPWHEYPFTGFLHEALTTPEPEMDSVETVFKKMELPIPADGVIPLHIEIFNDTEVLSIDASYEDSENSLVIYRKYTSPSQTYLQIQKPSGPAQVGSPLLLPIETNFPLMIDLYYVVKSRGQVVSAGKGFGDLTLIPEASWAPVACIIVYCVHPDGEIASDVIRLPIKPVLQNKVSLKWSDAVTRPAGNVTLKVTVAEPDSLVGILVVDKATRVEGSHNDITTEQVLKEMKEFDDSYADIWGIGDPYSVFKGCGLVALTDATLHQHKWRPVFPVYTLYAPMTPNSEVEQHKEEQPEPHERQNFPETWIWMDINTGDSDTKEIPLIAPDSITSWTATAFVLSERLGLGVVEQPAMLTVFQDFFLTLNLPACIIRGEELVLEVILYNYLPQQLEVTVVVAQSDTFEFIFPDSEMLPMPSVRGVSVGSESGATVLIPIRPLVTGEIPISVKAMSSAASDLVRTTVLVKAEGIEQLFSESLLFEIFPPESSLVRNINFTFPPDTVEDSQRITVTAVGDVLGPSISGLGSLIRMPSGCGEQNMINFAPNIYILHYLMETKQSNQDTVDRAVNYMTKGYERELSFQRVNGSFSAFGDRDSSGSTWLSAFVLRCFLQARQFIFIDPQVLDRVAAWIATQQAADGSFEEPGRVIHTQLQGGLDGPVSLTAYVLIALLEDSDVRARYSSQVSAALMYLETRLALDVSSNYSLSLLIYALALDGSSNARTALTDLIKRAEKIDGGLRWTSPSGSRSLKPRSADIEIASYVLLSLYKLGLVSEGISLMKWLSQQRNDRGGFGSTQDTIVALQALSTYAALGGSEDTDLTITVDSDSLTAPVSFHIEKENFLVYQSQQIEPQNVQNLHLQVTAEGRGIALFQLNVIYSVRNEKLMRRRRRHAGEYEPFKLDVELDDQEMDTAHLYICYSLSHDLGLNATGMAIMEVGLLSGFTVTPDNVETDRVVKKVETQPGKVILYLDSVTTVEMCLTIPLVREYRVAKVQGAAVLLYDYYEPSRRTVTTYSSAWRANTDACAFCGDDCKDCQADAHPLTAAAPSSRLHLLLSSSVPALLLLVIVLGM
ncbi:CD109 antigen [Stegastes partitus]|uniref:CD109 antigen n=1 Tax=Stegastes partitus TaxID=144197 RepID=A0A9Y4N1D0_9TELE|nr:PREDICTED: CD109 antigen-like [Stegastes partitus]